MNEDNEKPQNNTKKEYFVQVIAGLTVASICFVCGLFWVIINPFSKTDTDDGSSSVPSQSIESSPASSETLIPGFTSTSVPTPTPTTPHTQTPAQNPTPTPAPIMTPTPVSPEDSYLGSALSEGINVADDPLGEAQPDTDQYVVTGSIPEPPIDD